MVASRLQLEKKGCRKNDESYRFEAQSERWSYVRGHCSSTLYLATAYEDNLQ